MPALLEIPQSKRLPGKERQASPKRSQPKHHDIGTRPSLDRGGSQRDFRTTQRTTKPITLPTPLYRKKRSALGMRLMMDEVCWYPK